MSRRELHWKVAGRDLVMQIEEARGGQGTVYAAERSMTFVVLSRDDQGGWIQVNSRNLRYYVHRDGDAYSVWIGGHTYQLERIEKRRLLEQPNMSASSEVHALMPGKILRVEIKVGDTVAERQTLILMESMKMETALVAPRSGRIREILCQPGEVVDIGELLAVIE